MLIVKTNVQWDNVDKEKYRELWDLNSLELRWNCVRAKSRSFSEMAERRWTGEESRDKNHRGSAKILTWTVCFYWGFWSDVITMKCMIIWIIWKDIIVLWEEIIKYSNWLRKILRVLIFEFIIFLINYCVIYSLPQYYLMTLGGMYLEK